MSSTAYVVRVAAVIALVYGLYVAGTKAYSWMKGPEPGSRPWQVQKFRQDRRECSHFADRREAARRLLAWKPKPGPCIAAPAPPGTGGQRPVEWSILRPRRVARHAIRARSRNPRVATQTQILLVSRQKQDVERDR